MIYADQGRRLDSSPLELAREELKVRQDVFTYDALAWVLYKNSDTLSAGGRRTARSRWNNGFPPYYHAEMIALDAGQKTGRPESSGARAGLKPHVRPRPGANRGEGAREIA